MNRNHRKLLSLTFLISLLCIFPVTAHACPISDSYNLPSYSALSFHYDTLINGIYGGFTADVPIVAFIVNAEGKSYWHEYHIIPNSALWCVVGTTGSYDVNFPDSFKSHYVIFWNNYSSAAHIDYTIGVKITGFILVLIIFLVVFCSIMIICFISSQIGARKRKKSEVQIEFYR